MQFCIVPYTRSEVGHFQSKSVPQLHLNGHLSLGIPYSLAINPTQNRLISYVLVRYHITSATYW
jgi:hypothetical protein